MLKGKTMTIQQEAIESINKQITEKEMAILFLEHKDRWTSDDSAWYDKTKHEIKKLRALLLLEKTL